MGISGSRWGRDGAGTTIASLATLDPSDPIPFPAGWSNTARAGWRVVRPVWPLVATLYFVPYLSFLLESRSHGPIPAPLVVAALAASMALTLTLSAWAMADVLVGGTGGLRRAVAALRPALREVVLIGAVAPCLMVASSAWAPLWWLSLIGGFLIGPPLIIHAAALEGLSIRQSIARTRRRLRGRSSDTAFISLVVGAGALLVSGRAGQLGADLAARLAEAHTGAGVLLTSMVEAATFSAALVYISGLAFVSYLNAWSLTDGADSNDLRRLSEGRRRPWKE